MGVGARSIEKGAYSSMAHKIRRSRSNVYQRGDDDQIITHTFLDAGLRPRDEELDLVDVVFFAAAFAAAFGAEVPVAAFFAGARLEAVVVFFFGAAVDFVVDFLAGVLALVVVDLTAGLAEDLAAGLAAFVVDALVVLDLVAFLVVLAFVVDVLAVLGLVALLGLEAGLFSLAEVSALTLGASLTLPLTPLGSTKVPFSAPVEMALAS